MVSASRASLFCSCYGLNRSFRFCFRSSDRRFSGGRLFSCNRFFCRRLGCYRFGSGRFCCRLARSSCRLGGGFNCGFGRRFGCCPGGGLGHCFNSWLGRCRFRHGLGSRFGRCRLAGSRRFGCSHFGCRSGELLNMFGQGLDLGVQRFRPLHGSEHPNVKSHCSDAYRTPLRTRSTCPEPGL